MNELGVVYCILASNSTTLEELGYVTYSLQFSCPDEAMQFDTEAEALEKIQELEATPEQLNGVTLEVCEV